MIQLLLIIQIVVTILMIVTILLQRNTSDGLGGMGGGNMPAVSTDNAGPLAKLTGYLGAVFLINCLAMAAITSRANSVEDDIMDELGVNARIPVQSSVPEADSAEIPADAAATVDGTAEPADINEPVEDTAPVDVAPVEEPAVEDIIPAGQNGAVTDDVLSGDTETAEEVSPTPPVDAGSNANTVPATE